VPPDAQPSEQPDEKSQRQPVKGKDSDFPDDPKTRGPDFDDEAPR
jgi:hypothetical protein